MRFFVSFLLAFVLHAAPGVSPPDPAYSALRLYEGTWQVSRTEMPPGSKPETLVNQCAMLGKFFACAQTINGAPSGLIVFIPHGQPGQFWTQTILPEGRATGRDELQIAGDQWTYTSRRDQDGKTTFYRTINKFVDKNHIHFEQAQSNNGTDWKVSNSGEEVRTGRASP
jgi:hypothetical protein